MLSVISVAKNDEKQKTRPDLDDEHYLVYLSNLPENRGINVYALYKAMLDWCYAKGKTASRLRLLNWLNREREAMPMTAAPIGITPQPAPEKEYKPDPPCDICGKEICFSLHREERGI